MDQGLLREPCPGCGSRWHRDCRQHGKGKGKGAGSWSGHVFAMTSFVNAAVGNSFMLHGDTQAMDSLTATVQRWEALEPFEYGPRKARCLAAERERFAMVIDTAAPESLVGAPFCESYAQRCLKPQGLLEQVCFEDSVRTYRGIS